MIKTIYTRAFNVLLKKPLKLWGISLLSGLLITVFTVLFGFALGVSLAISILISTSMTMIYLRGYRGEEVGAVNLFDCFKDWATIKRVLCGMGWSALWIFLWGLIPFAGIVFAIIRSYEYRLVPYILVTEPEISPTEAIKVSRERTYGYKGKMFLADILLPLIYLGFSIIIRIFAAIPYIGVLFGLISFLVGICYYVLSPLFLGLVQAAFYEEIKNPTIPLYTNPYTNNQYGAQKPASFCPNCGAPIPEGSSFCANCGTNITNV